jgi:hypothetical protein
MTRPTPEAMTHEKHDYSVVLLRPDYMLEDLEYGHDMYVAHVTATNPLNAIPEAQRQAYEADLRNGGEPNHPDDYAVTLVLSGHVNVKLFGWQL